MLHTEQDPGWLHGSCSPLHGLVTITPSLTHHDSCNMTQLHCICCSWECRNSPSGMHVPCKRKLGCCKELVVACSQQLTHRGKAGAMACTSDCMAVFATQVCTTAAGCHTVVPRQSQLLQGIALVTICCKCSSTWHHGSSTIPPHNVSGI